MQRGELGLGAWIAYDAHWIPTDRADAAFADLMATLAWEQRSIVAFGREIPQPRLMAWAGELPYRYSGLTLEPRAEPPALAVLREAASAFAETPFNHAVVNLYRNGDDHVGWHADDEPELGRDPVIASISLGAMRRFLLSPKRKKRVQRPLRLWHGSMLVMGGSLQHTWRHTLPRDPSCTAPRINITFRHLHGPPGWRELSDG